LSFALDDLIDKARSRAAGRWDRRVQWKDLATYAAPSQVRLRFAEDGQGRSYRFLSHAFRQLASRLGMPESYVPTLPPKLQAKLIALERERQNTDSSADGLLVRGEGSAIRAILSTDYTPLDDLDMLNALREATLGIRVSVHWYRFQDERTDVRFTLDDLSWPLKSAGNGERATLGLALVNSEVGTAAAKLLPWIRLDKPGTGLVMVKGLGSLKQVHVCANPQGVAQEAASIISELQERGPEVVKRLDGTAKQRPLGGAAQAINDILEKYPELPRTSLVNAYQKDRHNSLYGVIKAVARLARQQQPAERLRLEQLAGELVHRPGKHGVKLG